MDENTLPENEQGLETETPTADPVTAAPDVEPGETPETTEDSGAKPAAKPDGVQRRFDELTRAKYDAQREAAYWRGKAEGDAVTLKPSDTAGDTNAEPSQEKFESYETYLRALARWEVSQSLQTERTRLHQEHQAQTVAQGFEAQVKSVREKHADFDAVVYNEDLQISETMRDAMIHSENGASLAYHLGTHPEEAASIANLPPMRQVMAIGRLQAKLEAAVRPQAPAPPATSTLGQASNAPAPISPVRASDGTFQKDPARMTDAEWWTASQKRKR